MSTLLSQIRNFSIVAHVDHGKSTLADRLLEFTGAFKTVAREQFLDSMELERERGITIKAKAVRMEWKGYVLNLLDTPGHVDFTFEVHRALWACEGVLLVVDASQGVQAQTVANCEIAKKSGLSIIPVVNKIDLTNAQVDDTQLQIQEILGITDPAFLVSAKTGEGVEELLDAIVKRIAAPPPSSAEIDRSSVLLFDSYMDPFKGVVLVVRVFDGTLKRGQRIRFIHDSSGRAYTIEEVGYLRPAPKPDQALSCGEVGYILCGLKDPSYVRHGDTGLVLPPAISGRDQSPVSLRPIRPLPEPLKPFVYVGLYPMQLGETEDLTRALERLHLTDPSFDYNVEASAALGPGFRCGFLGLLHLEIIQQRLKREFSQDVIITNPNVRYRVTTRRGAVIEVISPAGFPVHGEIARVEEPFVRLKILTPVAFLGPISELLKSRRGIHLSVDYLTSQSVRLTWELPLAEMVVDFYDCLKSVSRGYASLDYELVDYRTREPLAKVDVLLQGDPCDALSFIVPRDRAYLESRAILERLRELVPRQLFEVNLQAAMDGKIVAKERIAPLRKDVIAKCYGGDISRKMKLLSKQKEGKKRMRMVGKVEIPPEAFLTVLRKT